MARRDDVLEAEGGVCELPKIKEPLNLLKGTVADDLEQLRISEDQDARISHKSADTSFFGCHDRGTDDYSSRCYNGAMAIFAVNIERILKLMK